MKRLLVLFVFSGIFSFSFAQGKLDLAKLDVYLQKCMDEWGIPGMAVGIVYNDSMIFAKGYGVLEAGKPDKVNSQTMFGIASNTKAFTSAALATLVDEGKLSWDDPVRKYLPYFELYDPCASEMITVRDLLCHRAGFVTFSGDLLWHSTVFSREDIIRRVKFLKPEYTFRSNYGYSNLMFLTAGELVPAITGKSFDAYIAEKFFKPLGMTRTNSSIRYLKGIVKNPEPGAVDNIAIPHVRKNGKILPIRYISWDNIAPAGAINSNVEDMCKWMNMQINKGTWKGHSYFTKDASREMWSPQTLEKISRFDEYMFPSMHFHAYGLGWDMFDYHGRKIVNHSGGLDGMISQVVLCPEEKFGFVVLTNSINYLPYALMYKILDDYFGKEGKDYSKILSDYVKKDEENSEKERIEAEANRNKESKPSLKLEDYCGTYGGDLYGDAKIFMEKGKLYVQFQPAPEFISELVHWEYDIFQVEFKNFPSLPPGKLWFIMDQDGTVTEFKIDVPNPDFYFTELEFKKKAQSDH